MHLQKNRIRMKEMEIIATAGLNKENGDALLGMLSSYRKMLFPGTKDQAEKEKEELESRKRALAEEAQKAFIVRPVDIKKVLQSTRESNNPAMNQLAGRAIVEHERERMKQLRRKAQADQDHANARRRLAKMKDKK